MHQMRSSQFSRFHEKELAPHLANGLCWTGWGENADSRTAEPSESSWLWSVRQGSSDSHFSDLRQLLGWCQGGGDACAAVSTCCFTGQSLSLEISWKSPKLCRWEITDGMSRLLSCEIGIFCTNGAEHSLRAGPYRCCLVILSGGVYRWLNKGWWGGVCLPGQQEDKTVLHIEACTGMW